MNGNGTALIRRIRDTVQTDERQGERLRQQSALLHAELHADGEVTLKVDRSLALDVLLAIGEWVRERETTIRGNYETTLNLNLHTVRMRLFIRDLAAAIEASSRQG